MDYEDLGFYDVDLDGDVDMIDVLLTEDDVERTAEYYDDDEDEDDD